MKVKGKKDAASEPDTSCGVPYEVSEVSEVSLERLERMDPEELIEWAFVNFKRRAAIGTSFQLTGSVIVDMAARRLARLGRDMARFRVFTVDTGRLHPETHSAVTATEERYGIKVERFFPDQRRVHEMVERFGEYLFFTDKAKQEHCCQVRKVEPNTAALETLDVWITGLRRDQSGGRSDAPKASFIDEWDRKILKLSPLVDWTIEDVRRYISSNNVPYNTLFDKGYDSVGCFVCSTPLVKGEEPRSGRWRWFNTRDDDNKECGIHLNNVAKEAKENGGEDK